MLLPPPLYVDGTFDMDQSIINGRYTALYPTIAERAGLNPDKHIVDIFTAMGGKELTMEHLFCDPVHPNDDGYAMFAQTIYEKIFAK